MLLLAVSAYEVWLAALGVLLIAAFFVPGALHGRAGSFPMVCLVVGVLLFALPLTSDWIRLDPLRYGLVTEHLTELVVIVALMGAGLKLDWPKRWRDWSAVWRLLGVTMPVTIAGVAALGWWAGLPVASAVLLGAVLAPTDPVLASEVQVPRATPPAGPGEEDAGDPVRFELTAEAGLNDGLAFPFTHLAVALAGISAAGVLNTDELSQTLARWLALDVAYRVAVGVAVGYAAGRVLAWLLFVGPLQRYVVEEMEAGFALAVTLVAYAAAELCAGYGFLAVFVAALRMRSEEKSHEYHRVMHDFVDNLERVLTTVVLLLVGGMVAQGLLGSLAGWADAAVAAALVLVVRPVAGFLGLIACRHPTPLSPLQRTAIATLGIRGVGSFYYLAFAANHADFPEIHRVWAIVVLAVTLSVLVHGLTAGPAIRRVTG